VSAFISNPEFLRNARIQLRAGRAIAAVVICAAISLTVWYSYESRTVAQTVADDSLEMFRFLLQLQVVVLLIGGGIYELLSVYREKELNTFDYQRVTRLTSFELAMGKLFGAPVLTYLVLLCLMPIAILGAILGQVPILLAGEAYLILFLGCIAFHLLALLISMVLGRGASAIAILPFLILVAFTSIDFSSNTGGPAMSAPWALHQLSPFTAPEMFSNGTPKAVSDFFFGVSVSHFAMLMLIYATFGLWFLLAIVRNLKRDPTVYELYSPVQAFGFSIYLSFLMVGFFNWKAPLGQPIVQMVMPFRIIGFKTLPPLQVEQMLLFNTFWIFVLLGLILLRNRERLRRRIRTLGESAASWWAALWPAPYAVAGVIMVGIAIVELIRIYRNLTPDQWSLGLALIKGAFIALWVARDLLYLQWMELRRSRRPLVMAGLFLIVFYTCIGVILSVAHTFARPTVAAFGAALIPAGVSSLEVADWTIHSQLWVIALLVLAAQAVLFALLQWLKLREFLSPIPAVPIAPTPAPVTTGSLFPR
jgi:hypothetical protein